MPYTVNILADRTDKMLATQIANLNALRTKGSKEIQDLIRSGLRGEDYIVAVRIRKNDFITRRIKKLHRQLTKH